MCYDVSNQEGSQGASWEDMGTAAFSTSVLLPSLPSLSFSLIAWSTHTLSPFTDLYFCHKAFLQLPDESCSPALSNIVAFCLECSQGTQSHPTWYSGNIGLKETQTYVFLTYEPFIVLSPRHNCVHRMHEAEASGFYEGALLCLMQAGKTVRWAREAVHTKQALCH